MAHVEGTTFDLASYDEVEASGPMGQDAVSEIAALAEAEAAISKSDELCKRLDPEEVSIVYMVSSLVLDGNSPIRLCFERSRIARSI
jgi:hypothetical protein